MKAAMIGGLLCAVALWAARAEAQSCGNINYIGCCDGTTAMYCDKSGNLVTKDCSQETTYKQCGWYNNKYTCTNTENSDPSGIYPRLCTDLPDGGIPVPDSGPQDSGPTVSCGNITSQGCCDGEVVKYCYKDSLHTHDCTAENDPKCGWDSGKSFYTCGTAGDADPSGTYPMACPAATPDGGGTTDTGGTTTDSGGTTTDSGGTTKPKESDDGCGCAVHEVPGTGSLWLLMLGLGVALLGLRRRR
jgi:MYXO-CTERM domain-containing protein